MLSYIVMYVHRLTIERFLRRIKGKEDYIANREKNKRIEYLLKNTIPL